MRYSKRVVAEQFIPTSTTPPSDVGIFRIDRKTLGVTGKIRTFDHGTKMFSDLPQTIFQSGIPFWLPPGDGGANGLSFTDSAGNFTLSAAIVTNFWNFLSAGGYCYLPAGAGGLTTGGLYWCKMTSDTAGTVYADTYSGSMNPVFVASPTALSGITTGRITQSTSAIEITRFIMPANSMGPNGTLFINVSRAGDASATNKVLLVYLNSSAVVGNAVTTAQVGESSFIVRNIGVSNKQINPRSSGIGGYGGTVPSSMYSSVDTTNDVQVSVAMQIAANTASQILNGCMFEVRYGA